MPQMKSGLPQRRQDSACSLLLFLQARLFQHTIQRAGRDVNAELTRDRYGSAFRRVMKLAMATLHPNLEPAICLKQTDEIVNLHRALSTFGPQAAWLVDNSKVTLEVCLSSNDLLAQSNNSPLQPRPNIDRVHPSREGRLQPRICVFEGHAAIRGDCDSFSGKQKHIRCRLWMAGVLRTDHRVE
jgi:hypothetical protein